MSERPQASHHSADEASNPTSGVTDEVTPDAGEMQAEDATHTDADVSTNDPAEKDDSPSGLPAEHPDTRLAAERLSDLQRLQAEYVNYKRRVDRDRALVQERAVADVIDSLLPVLDDIHAAREHGDLVDGPFAAIAEKLETSLSKFGLERFGALGESFDPTVHEALLHQEWDGSIAPADPDATTVVMVLQPGYRAGERIIRPARVAVADPS